MQGVLSNTVQAGKYSYNTPITAPHNLFRPCIGSNLYASTDWNRSTITIETTGSFPVLYWTVMAISY